MRLDIKTFLPALLISGLISIGVLVTVKRLPLPVLLIIMLSLFIGSSIVFYILNSRRTRGDFYEAIRASDIERVKKVLADEELDVNARDREGWTPLHIAVHDGNRDMIQLLIARGADVNVRDRSGRTPLYQITFWNDVKAADLLLSKGADVNAKDNNGSMALHNAVKEGYRDVARLLLIKGADVNAEDNDGNSPLKLAVSAGHRDIVELLRSHGAVDSDGDPRAAMEPLPESSR